MGGPAVELALPPSFCSGLKGVRSDPGRILFSRSRAPWLGPRQRDKLLGTIRVLYRYSRKVRQ